MDHGTRRATLLDHMREFMRQEMLTGSRIRVKRSFAEEDVATVCERLGVKRAG